MSHAGRFSQRARREAKKKFQNTQDAVPSNLLISTADRQFKHPQQPLSPKHRQHRVCTASNLLRVKQEGLMPPLNKETCVLVLSVRAKLSFMFINLPASTAGFLQYPINQKHICRTVTRPRSVTSWSCWSNVSCLCVFYTFANS